MPERLLLRIAPDGGLAWLRQSGTAVPDASTHGAPPASVLDAAGEVVVLVPGEDVLLAQARIGARNRAQLMQALPFALEDQLLAPVEELHFAAASPQDGSVGAAVVAKERMREWLARLAEAGVRPDAMLPETLALAPETGLVDDARAQVRLAPWVAFCCAPGQVAEWSGHAGAASAPTLHDPREATRGPRDALAFLGGQLAALPLNLLDGEFAAARRGGDRVRGWRQVAMLAAAVVLLAFANLGVEVLQLSRTSARLDRLEREAVTAAFPDVDAAQLDRVGAAGLMRSRLERLHGGAAPGGLLRMLASVAPVLGATPTVQTRGMEYRNGTFELAVRVPDVAALDSLRERIALAPGIRAEVTAANPGADGVDGRIRLVADESRGGGP